MSEPTSPAKPIVEKLRQSFSALTQNEAMTQAAEDFRRQSQENVKVAKDRDRTVIPIVVCMHLQVTTDT